MLDSQYQNFNASNKPVKPILKLLSDQVYANNILMNIFFVIRIFIIPILYFVYIIQLNQICGMFSRQTEDQFH